MLNSGEGTVSVFYLANPLIPLISQTLPVKNAGLLFGSTAANTFASGQPFHVTLSPDEKSLFAVSQHTNTDFTTNYNYLHALSIRNA